MLSTSRFNRRFFSAINRIGNMLPKSVQRRISDFPGVLGFFQRLSKNTRRELITDENMRLIVNPLFHSSVAPSGKVSDYEPVIRAAILKFTKPGMTAYDLGANVGVFSFLFASLVGKEGIVYAFEPEENNAVCFQESVRINRCTNVVLHKRAVGKSLGTASFDRRGGAFSGRLIDGSRLYGLTENVVTVDTVTIDHLVNEESLRPPDIMKIDVEGNELMVIEGMRETLKTCRPILICELHKHLGDARGRLIELLKNAGYDVMDANAADEQGGHKLAAGDISQTRYIVAIERANHVL